MGGPDCARIVTVIRDSPMVTLQAFGHLSGALLVRDLRAQHLVTGYATVEFPAFPEQSVLHAWLSIANVHITHVRSRAWSDQ